MADPIEEPTPSSTESRCSTPPPLPSSPTTGAGGEAAAFCFPVRGQKWADRFEILEQIDEDAGGLVYRARDAQAAGQVVALWILPPEVRDAVDLAALGEELQRAQALDHKNLVRVHGWGEARAGLHFWMEYVSGQRLSALIEKKRKVATSAAFSLKGSYNLVAHLLHALSAAHPRLVHGALSPDAVLIDGRGRVRLLGLGISRHLPRPPGSSDFRGPESEIGPAADIYAAAMIFAELASGKPGKQALAALAQPLLREAIGLATDADPQKRPPDVESLRVLLQEALQQAKSDEPRAEEDQDLSRQPTELLAQREASTVPTPWPASGLTPVPRPRGGTPPPASAGAERAASPPPRTPSPPGPLAQGQPSGQRPLPGQGPVRAPSPAQPGMPGQTLGPAKGNGQQQKRSYSSMLLHKALEKLKSPGKQEAVWLAHRDGLDYGPFSLDELVDRVRKEEFDQTTIVQDLTTGQRKPLLEFPEFEGPLARLVREREAKRKEAQAVRQGQIRSAKRMGRGLVLLIVLGSASFLGFTSWLILHSPTPKPLLHGDAMASLGQRIDLPPIEPAEELAAKIRAEEEKKAAARARAREVARLNYVPGAERMLGSDNEFEAVVQRIDLSAPAASDTGGGAPLTDQEVDRTVRAHWGRLSSCVAKELKRNPDLDHATITFWVRGDGSTGGTKIQSNGTQRMFQCLQGEIAALRFRAHGGPPRKVTYPLQVQN